MPQGTMRVLLLVAALCARASAGHPLNGLPPTRLQVASAETRQDMLAEERVAIIAAGMAADEAAKAAAKVLLH